MHKMILPHRQTGSIILIIIGTLIVLSVMAMTISTILTAKSASVHSATLMSKTRDRMIQAANAVSSDANKTTAIPTVTAPSTWATSLPAAAPVLGTATAMGSLYGTLAVHGIDAWQSSLGYCTYAATADADPVFAVISAGADRTFQTGCNDALVGTPVGDDMVVMRTAANIRQGDSGISGFGDPVTNVADLDKIAVTPGDMRVVTNTGLYVNRSGTTGKWTLIGGGGVAPTDTLSCPAGYVPVPSFSLPSGKYIPAFCVMQFEARNINGIANADVSIFGTQSAWTSQTWLQAKAHCKNAGARLISDTEWLSIAHQALMQPGNWSGGAIGSGVVPAGWSANAGAGDTWSNNSGAPINDTSCLFNVGANQCGASGDVSFRRTHILGNGSVIWDMAGSAWEYTDWTLTTNNTFAAPASDWYPYNSSDGLATNPVTRTHYFDAVPPRGWNAQQGMGRYYTLAKSISGAYSMYSEPPYNCTGLCSPVFVAVRGGGPATGHLSAGLFALYLYNGPSSTYNTTVSFRCVK